MRLFEAAEPLRFSVTVEGMGHRAIVIGTPRRLPEMGEVVRVLNDVRDVIPQVERATLYEYTVAAHDHRMRAALRADDVTWCLESGFQTAVESTFSLSDRALISVRAGGVVHGLGLASESLEWLSRACGAEERGVEPCVALACTIARRLLS